MAVPMDPNISKVLDDAATALNDLYRQIASTDDREDSVPDLVSRRAKEALLDVQQILNQNPEAISEYPRKGLLRDIVDKIGPRLDSPSVQTALGTAVVDLMGVFKNIQLIFHEKDTRRVFRKDSDPLGRNP